MGFWDRLFGDMHTPGADGKRILDVPSGNNVRELGGFVTSDGQVTQSHRFLRSGSTQYLNRRDIDRLCEYGVTHVLDLRGRPESPKQTDCFSRERRVRWHNVELYGSNLSDERLLAVRDQTNYLASAYLSMLANHEAVRGVLGFLAEVPFGECALFHCAAGMDRTGMTAMLLLGLVGVTREQIVKDYLYSFAPVSDVDYAVEHEDFSNESTWSRLSVRYDTICQTYDALCGVYGDVATYLAECGVTASELDAVRAQLLKG